MSNEEIVKSLEQCVKRGNRNYDTDVVLDLIKHQVAEIDSLRADLKRVCAERDAHICTNNFIKSKAVKEFAERLKEKAITYYTIIGHWVSVKDIDNLIKEMVGDKE